MRSSVACLAFAAIVCGVAAAQTSVWFRVSSSSQQAGLTRITPDGFITWTNQIPGADAALERSYWNDGFWSRNFSVSNVFTSNTTVCVQWGVTNPPPDTEVCTHNLFLIRQAKWKYFQINGGAPYSFLDLVGVGLPANTACPSGGTYSIGNMAMDPQ